jgi:predicted transposase/invertase (TIGR01784 family)
MAETNVKAEDDIFRSVYINPLTDFGFKKIFLNRELLIAFLNDVVGTDIKEVTYLPTEGLGEYKEERAANFDLLCTNEKGEFFIVEMQLGHQTHFRDRILFYASHAIRKQAPRKKRWDFNLKAVYVVSILSFVTFGEESAKDDVIERVYLYREKAKTLFSDKLRIIFIELPKFNRQPSELRNNTDTWLFLLRNTFDLKTRPPEITGRLFKLFLEIAEIKHITLKEMETYQKSLKNNYYVRDIANFARMQERMERSVQFATKLLKRGDSIEEVIELTDLSKEQIMELNDRLPKS